MSFDLISQSDGQATVEQTTQHVSVMILLLCRGQVHNVTTQLAKLNGVITKESNIVSVNFGLFNDHQRLKNAQVQVQFVTQIK